MGQRGAVLLGAELVALAALSWLVVSGVAGNRGVAAGPIISIGQAWARATPPGVLNGAAYLTIANDGGAADTLLGAETPRATGISIHTTVFAGGNAAMTAAAGGLAIAAGGSLAMAPGGTHLMLSLSAPLAEGDTFPLTLIFAIAGRRDVAVTVLGFGAAGPAQAGGGNAAPDAAELLRVGP